LAWGLRKGEPTSKEGVEGSEAGSDPLFLFFLAEANSKESSETDLQALPCIYLQSFILVDAVSHSKRCMSCTDKESQ